MSKKRENIILTKRDLLIFHTLNELGFCSSKNLKNIVSPETQHKTFNIRLLMLKKHWFIKEIEEPHRAKHLCNIYMLNDTDIALQKIYNETWTKYTPSNYNRSYSLYNHQLLLWDLFSFLLEKIRNKNSNFSLKAEDFLGSKSIQKILQTEQKNTDTIFEYLDYIMIPDLILTIWNTVYCLELENMNSYRQFNQKILWYEDMNIRSNNKNFFPLFKEKNIFLVVACWNNKQERYQEVLKNSFTGKKVILEIENL